MVVAHLDISMRNRNDGLVAFVSELGSCRREGGPRVLAATLDGLDHDSIITDGANVAALLCLEITEAISQGVSQDVLLWVEVLKSYADKHGVEVRKKGDEDLAVEFGRKAVPGIIAAMTAFRTDAKIQLLCMGASSTIIGMSLFVLGIFLQSGGFGLLENAMLAHPSDSKLQLRAVKQLASATAWTDTHKTSADYIGDNAIAMVKQAMILHPNDADIQLQGMEALTKFVGISHFMFEAFASGGGFKVEEDAMQRHPQDARVQMKGIKALASGLKWTDNQCRMTNYCPDRAVALTKQAMALHLQNEELQTLATEKLRLYLTSHGEAVGRCGGVDLVKSVLLEHTSEAGITKNCKYILSGLGESVPSFSSAPSKETRADPKTAILELSKSANFRHVS